MVMVNYNTLIQAHCTNRVSEPPLSAREYTRKCTELNDEFVFFGEDFRICNTLI
jgi:hypothetical protein